MIESIKALYDDWKETRDITLEFIKNLSEADLDKKTTQKCAKHHQIAGLRINFVPK